LLLLALLVAFPFPFPLPFPLPCVALTDGVPPAELSDPEDDVVDVVEEALGQMLGTPWLARTTRQNPSTDRPLPAAAATKLR
jgi:hypothetical protein